MRIGPRVLIGLSFIDGCLHGVLDKSRRFPVGKALAQIDGSVLLRERREFVPDGGLF